MPLTICTSRTEWYALLTIQAEEAQVKEILTQEMEGAGSFSVPLIADANAGHSWAEAKG